jgi:hypothetical protein
MRFEVPVLVHVALWIAFFVAQVTILFEVPLTFLALGLCVTLLYGCTRGEYLLFGLGVGMALVIELGLGLVARSQHWMHASFFGIPFWLPLIWGYGFVVMRRVGNFIVGLSDPHD